MFGPYALVLSLLPAVCLSVGHIDGGVVRGFAPIGRYAGHWGIDIAQPTSSPVPAATAGVVTFAGMVAGRRSVTVSFGPSVKVSYSYLESIRVAVGQTVGVGTPLGMVGMHGGTSAYHLSLRVGGVYVDPMVLDRCLGPPGPAVRLAPSGVPYPEQRVRHPRRNLRPAPRRSSRRGTCGLRADGARSRASPPCEESLAEA